MKCQKRDQVIRHRDHYRVGPGEAEGETPEMCGDPASPHEWKREIGPVNAVLWPGTGPLKGRH